MNCNYAHQEEELRVQPNLKKTKLCNAYLGGRCLNGVNCSFAHGEDELRATPDFYKTALCIPFMEGNPNIDIPSIFN